MKTLCINILKIVKALKYPFLFSQNRSQMYVKRQGDLFLACRLTSVVKLDIEICEGI